MQERAIHISSVDRQKIGQNKAEDFTIKFDPVLKLQSNMTHEIALDKATMTYSWHNISYQYQNNQIKYSPARDEKTDLPNVKGEVKRAIKATFAHLCTTLTRDKCLPLPAIKAVFLTPLTPTFDAR